MSAADGVLARRCLVAGALLMLLGVALGAFGAHGLEGRLTPRRLASFQTGVHYQQIHALGLLLFSGAIYLLTAGAPRWFGMVAPVGGVSMMAAWLALAVHALRAGEDATS
jgi:uncharacterized membrane protein YgdD (TMEM256/DUF423 family)